VKDYKKLLKEKKKYLIIIVLVLLIIPLSIFFFNLSIKHSSSVTKTLSSSGVHTYSAIHVKHWIIGNDVANELHVSHVGSKFIQSINIPSTYQNGFSKQGSVDLLPNATHIKIFQSYQAIKSALDNNSIPPDIKVIGYDNEHWSGTPVVEQQQPFTYVPLAEQIVHQHGLLFMNCPAADLKGVLDPSAPDNYTGYLDEKLATLSQYTDIFEIQAQNTRSVSQYISFAQQAMAQARTANSKGIILLGITAKTGGPTSDELVQEIQGTNDITDGYWFNIIGGSSGVTIALPVIQTLFIY
jgi:hypothetical protein